MSHQHQCGTVGIVGCGFLRDDGYQSIIVCVVHKNRHRNLQTVKLPIKPGCFGNHIIIFTSGHHMCWLEDYIPAPFPNHPAQGLCNILNIIAVPLVQNVDDGLRSKGPAHLIARVRCTYILFNRFNGFFLV